MKLFGKIKKQIHKINAALIIVAAGMILCTLSSCADANGLHNQQALFVTIKITGFGNMNGSYSLPGNYDGKDGWDNSKADIVLKNGEGVSEPFAVTSSNIQWTIVPVGSWNRDWYVKGEFEANGVDNTSGKNTNFYIDGLDLSAGEIVIVLNGEANPTSITPEVE